MSRTSGPSSCAPRLLTCLAAAILAGCGVGRMLPRSAAVDPSDRTRIWGEARPSGADYAGSAPVDRPVVPFLAFAVPYDLDIVLVSNHPAWEMHEVARVRTPDGPVWLAKDTRSENGNQMLVTSSASLFEGMPEIPLAGKRRPVEVRNLSQGGRLKLDIRYRNFDGERVRIEYGGRRPSPVRRRNGSTMGHSRHEALAVLDLSHRSFGARASIEIGGRSYRIRRAAGLAPLQLAIRQVQGGVAEASYRYAGGEGRVTRHARPGREPTELRWAVERSESRFVLRQTGELRTLVYRFLRTDSGAAELVEVAVDFWNAEDPIFRMRFAPALPDPRRPFDGEVRSRWVVDVGEGRGHAEGTARLRSDGNRAELRIDGSAPWWVADRCTVSEIEFPERSGPRVETTVEPCEDGGRP